MDNLKELYSQFKEFVDLIKQELASEYVVDLRERIDKDNRRVLMVLEVLDWLPKYKRIAQIIGPAQTGTVTKLMTIVFNKEKTAALFVYGGKNVGRDIQDRVLELLKAIGFDTDLVKLTQLRI
jgi:hypothetical protein